MPATDNFILPPPSLGQQNEQAEPAEREQEPYRFDIKRAAKPIVIISLYLIAFQSLALFYTLITITASSLYVLYPQAADEWINRNQIMLTGSALGFILGGGGIASVAGLAAGAWIGHVAQKILHQAEQRTRPVRNVYQMATHPRQTLSASLGWAGNICQRGWQQGRHIIVDPTRNVCHTVLQSVQTRTQGVKNWFSTLSFFREENEEEESSENNSEDNESLISEDNDSDDNESFFSAEDRMTDDEEPLLRAPAPTYLPISSSTSNHEAQDQDTLLHTRSPYARQPLHPPRQ